MTYLFLHVNVLTIAVIASNKREVPISGGSNEIIHGFLKIERENVKRCSSSGKKSRRTSVSSIEPGVLSRKLILGALAAKLVCRRHQLHRRVQLGGVRTQIVRTECLIIGMVK